MQGYNSTEGCWRWHVPWSQNLSGLSPEPPAWNYSLTTLLAYFLLCRCHFASPIISPVVLTPDFLATKEYFIFYCCDNFLFPEHFTTLWCGHNSGFCFLLLVLSEVCCCTWSAYSEGLLDLCPGVETSGSCTAFLMKEVNFRCEQSRTREGWWLGKAVRKTGRAKKDKIQRGKKDLPNRVWWLCKFKQVHIHICK